LLNGGTITTRRWSSTLSTGKLPWTSADGVRLGWTLYSWSMEFDIVEAGNAITRSRRSMEFDIVELGNVGAIATIRRLDTKLKGS